MDPVALKLDGDPPRISVVDHALESRILAALARGPLSRRALRDQLGVRAETLAEALHRLAEARKIRLSEGHVCLS